MYKIIFIDESHDDIDNFADYVESNKNLQIEIDLINIFPLETIDALTEKIFSINADAIIVDFMLNEYKEDIKYNVPYNGVDLVKNILSIKEGFPCFVITAFDDDAIKVSDDVNLVYIKDILHGAEEKTGAKTTFLERVINQIEHYKTKIINAGKEFNELLKKSERSKLNAVEEEKLVTLDDFLEKVSGKSTKIPRQLKKQSTLDDLHKLIETSDKLLKKLDENDSK